MNIRQAILKAAAHIERNPSLFDFKCLRVPPGECGTPGCVLGWIGFFAQVKSSYDFSTASNLDVSRFMGIPDTTLVFYERMSQCSKQANGDTCYEWRSNAEKCAKAMRVYADRYHPADSNFARDIVAKVQQMAVIAEDVH